MSIDFDFSGVSLNESPAEEGIYPVEIEYVDGYVTKTGNKRVTFKAKVCEGESKGCVIKDGINLPTMKSQGVKKVWLGFFRSLGMSPAEVADVFGGMSGKGDENAEFYAECIGKVIVGLKGYCYYAPAVEEGGWPTRNWLTPQQARAQAKTRAKAGGSDDALGDFINV